MRNIKHKFMTVILPALILTPLLWLMAGCFYVPWFEHRIDTGPNIRALIGPTKSRCEIRPFCIKRSQVIARLGPPRFLSLDGTAIGYVMRTRDGYWVWPLCFGADTSNDRSYVVRLVFDQTEELIRFDWATSNNFYGPLADMRTYSDFDALAKLNRQGSPRMVLAVLKSFYEHQTTTQP